MILSALNQYYERLNNDEQGKVPAFGFSEEKISYVLVLSEQGELVDQVPNLTDEKKPKPKLMNVPRPEKRTSGIKPNFLWDKTAYVLGISLPKDKKSEALFELNLPTFEACRKWHLSLLEHSEDKGLKALVIFLQNWQPDNFDGSILTQEILDANVVFQLDGTRQYIHESAEAKRIWGSLLQSDDVKQAMCLITGEQAPISRLHPAIKGVSGGQSSGVSIVSFNKESFESFGKEQGDNAPVSEKAAFAYTTALNYLLRRENDQVINLGDTSVVFWAQAESEQKAKSAEAFFIKGFNPPMPTDDSEVAALGAELEKLVKGRPLAEISPDLDPNTQFFILGLAPNAARLSIRFWLQTDLGHIQRRFAEHFQDLALNRQPWKTAPTVWRIILELIPTRYDSAGNKKKKDINDAPAHLAGELMRSILTGQCYPRAILAQLLSRFRADGDISRLRVAMVKAVLQREQRLLGKEDIAMELDDKNNHPAYLLGRMFALLENIQREALGKDINSTIKDKYFAAASTVPYSVFPRLLTGSNHHLSKIKKLPNENKESGHNRKFDNRQLAEYFENEISKIIIHFKEAQFPKHFSIEEQGRFSIGYYQQKYKPSKKNISNEIDSYDSQGTE
ncbi:type I-C CRISPR-associated protein Cas8c/Csd1 [Pseudoalteromonas sp. OF7H-1]|uniref:type I-C CRISPR-associated protein Cas8c/Csd1 n=1 Tax=Pseudoalteromonas sp. OF7H-1 TaxID=2917755 RepID=UPI001EF46230|nr:type I-C CRISPR-associated protein Cas8c/Csd1 [Pseudoalteromonas sp. OF7H-1]MCG7540969.1 type I-C CRISPR-associated protein Cas8c/Csd1 [Pseudoalteromonas sp. OF7H-1]